MTQSSPHIQALDQVYTVLVVDDEPDLCVLYQTSLARMGYHVLSAGSVGEALTLLRSSAQIACVVSDFRLPDGTGLELATHVAIHHGGLPISIMTAYGSPEHAVQALKAGVFDYLTKPVAVADLRRVVASMLAQSRLAKINGSNALVAQIAQRIPGQSSAMQAVHAQLAQLSQTQACVVIQGESGTGKTLAAHAIHACSQRNAAPFVVFNSAGLEAAELNARLFGSEQHSSDGIRMPSDGAFQTAQGGTLLIEDVANLPTTVQMGLLGVLQERKILRVGSSTAENCDVRLLVSSARSLPQSVASGQFRQDLYYRLNVMTVQLPPLREREGDAAWLAQRWLAAHPQGKAMGLSANAVEWLNTQVFSGNVNELNNTLERGLAQCGGESIEPEHLQRPAHMQSIEDARYELAKQKTPPASQGLSPTQPALPLTLPIDLTAHLAQIERDIIEQALQQSRYNRTQAAALLGLNLRQLRYRIEQLGIAV
jgi:two-component system, NtrC family, response regulator PilR